MRKIKQTERLYLIRYCRPNRALNDSATTLEGARLRIKLRLSKPSNKREQCQIWADGMLLEVHSQHGSVQ